MHSKTTTHVLIFIIVCLVLGGTYSFFVLAKEKTVTVSNDASAKDAADSVRNILEDALPENVIAPVTPAPASTPTTEDMVVVTHIPTPEHVIAHYVSSWSFGSSKARARLTAIADDTDVNAMVIDVKDSTGMVAFDMPNKPKVVEFDSVEHRIRNPKSLIAELHKKNIYAIARIAVFQDGFLPLHQTDLAIQTKEAKPWKDRGGNYWVDQYSKELEEYILQVSEGAYEVGFDEINFDYIRFPSEGNFDNIVFPNKPADDVRRKRDVIADFLKNVAGPLREKGIPVSIDVFGYVASRPDDIGIGQHLETLTPLVDFIAPMVYPSHYYKGSFNFDKPAEHPYGVIQQAMKIAVGRLQAIGEDPNKLRPWIQDFDMGAIYTKDMIREEIRATFDNNLDSFMVWNAANRYRSEALIGTSEIRKLEPSQVSLNENVQPETPTQ